MVKNLLIRSLNHPTIQPYNHQTMNTKRILDFLKGLQQNNNKEWMDEHRDEYQAAKEEFVQIVNELLFYMAEVDENLRGVEVKDCIFRINRDIRFSNDKSPYKINFGAYISEGGKHSGEAGYYLHLQPNGESMLAGGVYYPSGEHLKLIRQEVDYNPRELKEIVSEPDFIKYFGSISGEKLSRPPRGYSKDHPNIEFLKLKSYIMLQTLSDEQVTSPDFLDHAKKVFTAMKPFNDYLNAAMSGLE
jgi:uncharacterized protein (TIGR02453 family)